MQGVNPHVRRHILIQGYFYLRQVVHGALTTKSAIKLLYPFVPLMRERLPSVLIQAEAEIARI